MAAQLMDTSPDLLLSALWLTAKIISYGTLGLFLVSQGNPREVRGAAIIFNYLNAIPPTAIFRWRKPDALQKRGGYEVTIYNSTTDEEEAKPAIFHPIRFSPTYPLWPKKGPQPKSVMKQRAMLNFLARLFFFIFFFLGSFSLLGWLAVTESWRWGVALEVLAVHQLAFARAYRYFVWLRGWLFAVIGIGVWVYLQGEVLTTVAVCTAGALVTISILGQWHMATSRRFQSMRDLEMGPFDPDRWKRPW
ncbi:hypothetical protein [Streptomyces sp. SCSIO ZS0520]|uniref:hypothetical protein n=1 Tax=Streptomyces sp. SCSIO ZS0520 TaxID=2892996 RepID=UPI0021DB5E6F|nr:hypothetical protein [Streptomyces sp. SCSIO ZS0520]